jgi:hypothetical protein
LRDTVPRVFVWQSGYGGADTMKRATEKGSTP